jgi:EAL domain-containing protein (putative c-di-GMP-specific phosphodiesterase class I)/DNA-binding response OmpR family regulator/GGDEF domain-containing protein
MKERDMAGMEPNRITTILIADDDPAHLLLAEAALGGAGFVVHTASDGEEAVRQFERTQPDCIVLDVNMPKMTGIEACQKIRDNADGRRLPILMLTGRNDIVSISDAFAAGASDFAQKGMNPRLLVERVRFLLRDRAMQDDLWSSRSKLLLAQRIARVGHWELTLDGKTLDMSPMVAEILEREAQPLDRYEAFVKMLDPAEQVQARQAFLACAAENSSFSFEHCVRTPTGKEVYIHQEAELVQASGSSSARTVLVTLQDLTRLRRAEDAVRTLSYFDSATGLPNRLYLLEQMSIALKDRAPGVAMGVVTFRVHGFDRIAQAHGNDVARRTLTELAHQLGRSLAEVSPGAAVLKQGNAASVCRTAEHALTVLVQSRDPVEAMPELIRNVLARVSGQPTSIGIEYLPPLSAGLALIDGSTTDADQLVTNAQAAADHAREPQACELFSPVPLARSRRRLAIESALRRAVESGEFHLMYQPRVASGTLDLTGVECLLRWEHPQLGTVGPEEFVPIAEESGLIEQIGDWVLDEACRQLAAWRSRFEDEFFVSVNVSARQLRQANFASRIKATLDKYRLPAQALEIEITETSIVHAPPDARRMLDALRREGVRVTMDDFGTGYSSLGQIRKLPFDCVKLDRSLMADLYTDIGAQGVTAAALAMAKALRIRSVAEGIEDPEAMEKVSWLGCEELQGYYISPPLKARDFAEWLDSGGAVAIARRRASAIAVELEASKIAMNPELDELGFETDEDRKRNVS